jgi:predicted nucleic acid-binding protein
MFWSLSAILQMNIGEYRLGIAQSRRRASYENWLGAWISSVSLLDIDDETAYSYALIGRELKKEGRPIPANDLWTAAANTDEGEKALAKYVGKD